MHHPPPPNPRDLLPPLLACLPTSFVSPQPPPALLPLLSPLLRQRLTFLSTNTTTRPDGWLPLLSWDAERAARLAPVVERLHLEPHPVSGELELDDVRPATYRRLDEETLHARLEVEQYELVAVYVWCTADDEGGEGWKLAELRSWEDLEDGTVWEEGIPDHVPEIHQTVNGAAEGEDGDSDGDDSYWAAYDRTPGRTPAQKASPAPAGLSAAQAAERHKTQERDYYARYGEVQPAMDSHDPDEENPEMGESGLKGDVLTTHRPQLQTEQQRPESRPNGTSLYPSDKPERSLEAPRPRSLTSSSGSSPVEKLESKAREMEGKDGDAGNDRALLAIQQHISTDVKSLFRLARSAGMERGEFEGLVRRELEVLPLLDGDD